MARKPACSVTGSGVVSPVWVMLPASPSSGGCPMPKVPTTPQRRPSAVSACAVHQAVLLLPLVPVAAITCSACAGWPNQAAANGPVAAFRPGNVAMRSSAKPKPSTPSASTRQAAAPAASAPATYCRPSVAAPGQAMKASPARTLRLSVRNSGAPCGRTRAASQSAACATECSICTMAQKLSGASGTPLATTRGFTSRSGGTPITRSVCCTTWLNTGAATAPP